MVYAYVETPSSSVRDSAAQERTYLLMQLVSDVGLRTTAGIQGLVVITAVRRPAEKEHQLASYIFVVMKIVARTGKELILSGK